MNILKKENYKYIVLLACMIAYCMSALARWNYTSISGYLVTDLGIGKPELGLLASAFFYAYTVAQLPVGLSVDKWGGRYVIPIGVALMGFACIGFALSATFKEAVVWRSVLGFVGASVYVPAVSLLAKWFPAQQRGMANNIFNGFGGGFGEILMFILVPFIALVSGAGFFGLATWRLSTVLTAVTMIIVAVIAVIFLRSDPSDMGLPSIQEQEEGTKEDENYKQFCRNILKDPALWGLGITWSGYIISTRLVLGWLATYAAAYYVHVEKMNKGEAMVAGGAIATMYVVGRYIGSPISGIVCDYLLKKRGVPRTFVLFIGLVAAVILFVLFVVVAPNKFTLSALAFFCGVVFNFYSLVNACAAEFWSIKGAGFSMGIVNTIGQLTGAISLSVSGFAAVRFAVQGGAFHTEYTGIWYCGVVVTIVAALVTYYLSKHEREIWKKRKIAG